MSTCITGYCRLDMGVPASHLRSVNKNPAPLWKIFHTGNTCPSSVCMNLFIWFNQVIVYGIGTHRKSTNTRNFFTLHFTVANQFSTALLLIIS